MFQFLLFTGSIIAFIIGGLIVLIGIGAITGCAGGLVIMTAGTIVALLGIWSAITFLIPAPNFSTSTPRIIDLINHDGRWR
ncbi:MAG: hypothetical protein C4518_08865 [Desulfobacteraceae bacterium]|nr:MAG: hypothetical protein C4518_08865 [Desulfobacteraceae bacterium]